MDIAQKVKVAMDQQSKVSLLIYSFTHLCINSVTYFIYIY